MNKFNQEIDLSKWIAINDPSLETNKNWIKVLPNKKIAETFLPYEEKGWRIIEADNLDPIIKTTQILLTNKGNILLSDGSVATMFYQDIPKKIVLDHFSIKNIEVIFEYKFSTNLFSVKKPSVKNIFDLVNDLMSIKGCEFADPQCLKII